MKRAYQRVAVCGGEKETVSFIRYFEKSLLRIATIVTQLGFGILMQVPTDLAGDNGIVARSGSSLKLMLT